MVLSLFLTETLGVTAGGIIVPGYIAMNLESPDRLLSLIYTHIKPDVLIVRGEKMRSKFHDYQQENPNIKTIQLPYNIEIKEIVLEFSKLEDYYIVGIGNMVGWGEKFVQDLKKYRV
jgi:hypothetical protein